MIRVGTAGWSYPDWDGVVYPRGTAASREALTLLARLFDVLEINVTFYRPPTAAMAESWVKRIADRPAFRFTAKLWQGFTHRRDTAYLAEEAAFKEGMAPLVDSGRLGALLVQYPHSFRHSPENLDHLFGLLHRFEGFPLVVEVRHASWMSEEAREILLPALTARGAGLCSVDQPIFGSSLPPHEILTGRIGYIRLHGRNRSNWFRKGAGRDARYDYLYPPAEMQECAERATRMRELGPSGSDIFIVANNHYRGQAVVNAIELKALLTGARSEIPPALLAAHPRLKEHAAAPSARRGGQGVLPL